MNIDIDRLLNFAIDAGTIMLQSGAETYRVEDTISRICSAFGIDNVEVFASPTTVIASIYKDKKIYSAVKRVNKRGTDLNMVHKVNSLSRDIYYNKPSIESCENKLIEITNDDSYSLLKILLFAGLSTAAFTVLFNGGLDEFSAAFVIGIVVKFVFIKLENLYLNEFFINILCGALVSILSIMYLELGLIDDMSKLVAGSLMLLAPGLAFTNTIRDLIEGELVSGVARGAQVFFIGLSIAIGTGSIINFYYKFGGF